MEKKLIWLQKWCDKNSNFNISWSLELYFNRGYKDKIQWGLGISKWRSEDCLAERENFFGDTPEEAIDKAMKNKSLLNKNSKKCSKKSVNIVGGNLNHEHITKFIVLKVIVAKRNTLETTQNGELI